MTVLRLLTVLPLIITVWATDPKVVVRQTFPYTKKVNNYKSIVVEKDADAYMACVVDNKPGDRKVQWFAQNFNSKTNIPISTDTDSQNPYKYQIDKPAANNWRLKVQNSQESDIALYICRVQLGGQQSANDSRMLIVQQKPQIIDIYTSDDSTVDEGDRVQLDCGAGGIPRPKISWMMAGGGVLPTGGRVLQQPQLIITSVTLEHRGAYICIAKNAAGEDRRRIVLDVEFYPRLTASNPEVRQAVGYGRDLMCEVKGNPVPGPGDLIWYSPLGVPLADENKYIFENFTGGNFVLMKMRITKVEPGDFGQYKCFAINKEGQGESFVNLVESYSPVDERTGRSGTAILSFSMLTLAMFIATSLLHFC